MIRFHRRYFLAAMLLLFVEVQIAAFVQDEIVRPYGGDYLVVIFLYCLFRSFLKTSVTKAVAVVFSFSILMEILQYLRFINFLELQENSWASTILGNHFEFLDILAYGLSALTIVVLEALRKPPEREEVRSHSREN